MPEASDVLVSFFIDLADRRWGEVDLQGDFEEMESLMASPYPYQGGLLFADEWGAQLALKDQVDYLLFQFLNLVVDARDRQGWSSIPFLTHEDGFNLLLMDEIVVVQLQGESELKLPLRTMKTAITACATRYREFLLRLPDRHPEQRFDINWLAELIEKSNAD